jgi:hypothetical protein
MLTFVLLALLAVFGILQLLGVQPREDNNRWLLYLFVLVWPLLSRVALVAAIPILRRCRREAIAVLVIAILSLAGFVVWGNVYAGLW